jgi:sugar-phosphatase
MSLSTWTGSAVLFDLDGTLIESTATIERHTRLWASRHGLDPDHILESCNGRRDRDIVTRYLPARQVETEMAWIHEISCRDVADITASPGSAELIAALAEGRWGIVTSGEREVALRRLAAAGLPVPGVLVTAEDVENGKPDPEGYLLGAALLGVEPSACVVFEDAHAGIAAALAAGMSAIMVGDAVTPSDRRWSLPSLKQVDARPETGTDAPAGAALRLDFTAGLGG